MTEDELETTVIQFSGSESRYFTQLAHDREVDICHTCGDIRTHSLIHCRRCGGAYCNHKHPLIEASQPFNLRQQVHLLHS